MLPTLINALRETLYMVLYSTLLSMLIGISFGMFLSGIANSPNRFNRNLFGFSYNLLQMVKAVPYILVMLMFIPLTNWFINHRVSFTSATIVPLTVAGSLLLAQAVYDIFSELRNKWQGNIKAMGASKTQTLLMILLPESVGSVLEACANVSSTIVGFSIIAGAFGAGGLGQFAIEKSITEPNVTYAVISILTLIAIQQIFKYTAILFIPQKHLG